jgi:hypothetical protein
MAPERARGEPPTSASDLWSLGATLFAAVQGRSPFQREGQLSTLSAVISEEPPPASDAGPLRPVIERLLRKQPGERPTIPQARAMLEAAEREMDAATTAPTPSRPAVARSAAHPRPHTEQPETTNQPETTAPLPTPRPTREQVQAGPTARAVTQPSAPAPTQPAAPAASAQVRSASLAAAPGSVAAPQAPDVVASAAPVKVPNPSAPASPAPPPARVPEESGEPAPSPPGKPEESQPLEPYPVRRGRRRWLTVGIPAVLLGLAALVAGLLMRGGAAPSSAPPVGPRTGTAGASVTASTSVPTPSASASAGAGQTSAGSTSKSSPSKNPSVVVPAGFHLFKDPSGFQVAIPDGWTRSRVSTRTYFKEPGGRRFLQVDQTTHPKADALADWRRQEVAVSQRFSGYQRIRMERVQYRGWNAADWEFTWQPGSGQLHVLSRNIRVSDRGAYALYWSVPSAQWSPSQRYFDTFAATFQPAADHR